MKAGKFKRFSSLCGIAKVEYNGEEFFVVYADYMKPLSHELGTIVGKGITEMDAMKMAIVNLSKNTKKLADDFQKIEDKLANFRMKNDVLDFDKDPIVSIEGWKYQDPQTIVDSGEFHNADLLVDTKGNAFVGLC